MSASASAVATARPWSRVMGLGTIFGKTLRDSRRAALIVGIVGGLFMIVTAAPYGTEFTTPASRAPVRVADDLARHPCFQGLLGEPIRIETLGGFLSWRVGNFLPVLLGLWSVHRAVRDPGRRGGQRQPRPGRRDAAQPAVDRASRRSAAHVAALTVAMLILAAFIYVAGLAFAGPAGRRAPDRAPSSAT